MSGRRAAVTRVLLADDHGVVRDGLVALLGPHRDIRVVATAADGARALREAKRLAPEVVLLEIAMAGPDGIETVRRIVREAVGSRVLVVSRISTPMMVRRALEAGASGYIAKESGAGEVIKGVRAVAAGKRHFCPGLAQKFLESYRGAGPRAAAAEELTATEGNLLALIANGRSNAQAAAALGLSRRTVETYRARLMHKLGIDSLAGLVKYAIRQGIVPLD